MIERIGHLHPLLIHLPIGILIFALMITILPAKQREILNPALSLALILTAISSFAACVAGYLLAQSGDYEKELVDQHQWLGIITCLFAVITLLVRSYKRQMVWATVVIMTIASHMGGTITHGEGFLFPSAKTDVEQADSVVTMPAADSTPPTLADTSTSIAEAPKQVFMYRDEVTPVLKNKCYSCHSAVKKKGGLRLDGENHIAKGGKNGSILTKGDPQNSVLYTHLLLPMEDDKHMPPKGKKQLTKGEIALIHRWIAKGAPYGPIEVIPAVNAVAATLPMAQTSAAPLATDDEASQKTDDGTTAAKKTGPVPTPVINPGNEASINALKQQGIIIEPKIQGGNGLAVNFVNVKNLDPAMMSSLNELRDQIVELKFTGQPLTDENLAALSTYKNLSKLQLDKTSITDKGLGNLKKFPSLESLNLYGTSVTDAAVNELSSNRNLKRVYLWQTGVTEQGLKRLAAARPDLKTEAGLATLIKPDSTKKK